MENTDTAYFPAGDAALTRLVKKLSEGRGLPVEVHSHFNRYGTVIDGYSADISVVEEARRILAERRELARSKEECRLAREEERRLKEWHVEVRGLYPHLEPLPPIVSKLYGNWESVPINVYSRSGWGRIGYEVNTGAEARSFCCLHGGRVVVPLYGPLKVSPRRSRYAGLSDESLWRQYREMGLTLAHAVWVANKLQKLRPHEKARFYGLKDRFLEDHQDALVEGRVARHETRECGACLGGDHEDCWKCGGTGIFSSRTLYEHLLDLDGRRWSFHSYVEPRHVGDTPGADLRAYGKRFTVGDRVPYRLPEYIRMIERVLVSGDARPRDR